jgi:hypothetical protein
MKKFIINGIRSIMSGAEENQLIIDTEGDVSDGYHTMHELYKHRMALNIALFHLWNRISRNGGPSPIVLKSKLHSDGTMFPDYFIVMAITKFGQISYHYRMKHWNKFEIPEVERAPAYDGHTSMDVYERLLEL